MGGDGRRIKVLTITIYICPSPELRWHYSVTCTDQRGQTFLSLYTGCTPHNPQESHRRERGLVNWNSGPEVLRVALKGKVNGKLSV